METIKAEDAKKAPPEPVDFTIPRRIELQYQAAIRKLLVPELPKKSEEMSFDEWLQALARMSERRDIADAAAFLAGQMIEWVNVVNARTWRVASARSQRSAMLYRLLQDEMRGPVGLAYRNLVRENAEYISSIPAVVARHLTGDIARAQQAGARPETVAKMMRHRFPELTSSRIELIARTETMKASSALTQVRSEALNLPFYIWITSEDGRVRPSHRNLNGVVIPWNDPPSPEALIGQRSSLGHYHSGNCPNCRCTQIVVLTLDDIFGVKATARVYAHGQIANMGRAQFARFSGIQEERAA